MQLLQIISFKFLEMKIELTLIKHSNIQLTLISSRIEQIVCTTHIKQKSVIKRSHSFVMLVS